MMQISWVFFGERRYLDITSHTHKNEFQMVVDVKVEGKIIIKEKNIRKHLMNLGLTKAS